MLEAGAYCLYMVMMPFFFPSRDRIVFPVSSYLYFLMFFPSRRKCWCFPISILYNNIYILSRIFLRLWFPVFPKIRCVFPTRMKKFPTDFRRISDKRSFWRERLSSGGIGICLFNPLEQIQTRPIFLARCTTDKTPEYIPTP